eukprot:192707_1
MSHADGFLQENINKDQESKQHIDTLDVVDYQTDVRHCGSDKNRKVHYSYNDKLHSIDVTDKDEYTIADLRKDVVSHINVPSHFLSFYLDFEPVCYFDMDIIQYFNVYRTLNIHFYIHSTRYST